MQFDLKHLSFSSFAKYSAAAMGTSWAFALAVATIVAWAITGPIYAFSETWQLVINTGTTIITFLMVFLIQNTQNRDAKALHLKLDELIRSINPARNKMIDLENCTDKELDDLQHEFERLRQRMRPPELQEGQDRSGRDGAHEKPKAS